jgi:hypothetical protein
MSPNPPELADPDTISPNPSELAELAKPAIAKAPMSCFIWVPRIVYSS